MKRIISAFLSCTLLLTVVLPSLSGCSGASNKYTVGEWLRKVNEMFSLSYFTQAEPLVNGVSEDDEYFAAVQIAADWGVIDEGSTIKTSAEITREFCADTLVRAMNFDYDTAPDIKDADKLSCARTVGIALNEGIMTLDGSGKFNPSKKVSKTDADIALLTAYDKWINLSYEGDEYFEAEVKEGVVNLGGLDSDLSPVSCTPDDYTVSYSKTTLTFNDNGQIVDDIDKTITFKNASSLPAGITTGSVLTLPADEVMPTSYCVIVDGITNNADGSVSLKVHNGELFDAYETISVKQSDELDFSQAVIYDAEGNRLELTEDTSVEDMLFGDGETAYNDGLYHPTAHQFMDTKSSKKYSTTIKLGDMLSLKLSVDDKGVSTKTTVKSGVEGLTFVHDGALKNFKFETDLKLGWFSVKKLRFVTSCDTSNKFTVSAKAEKKSELKMEKEDLYNLYQQVTQDSAASKSMYSKAGSAFTTRLCTVVIPTGTGIDATLFINGRLTLTGEIYISIETADKFGVELVKGKLRDVRSHEQKVDYGMEAKAEATLYAAAGISALGCIAADAGVEIGVGAKASSKLYQMNSATETTVAECAMPVCFLPVPLAGGANSCAVGHDYTLTDDICVCTDFKVYPIVKIVLCSDSSLVGKWIAKLEFNVLGEEDAFISKHWEVDNGVIDQIREVDKCSREAQSGYNIETGKELTLSHTSLPISIGEDNICNDLKVVTIPKGYKVTDLVMTSEDDSIASVENLLKLEKKETKKEKLKLTFLGGAVETTYYQDLTEAGDENHTALTGKTDGVTMITVATKDGKYSAQVKVVVGNGGFGDAVIGSFLPKVYAYSLDPGATAKIEIGALPKDITAADIQYTSRDTAVATVSASGLITAVGDGVTTIDITTTDGNYKASVSVFVYEGAAAAIAESAA